MNVKYNFISPAGKQDMEVLLIDFLSKMFKKLGKEQLEQSLELILLEWAAHHKYIMCMKRGTFEFVHVSLHQVGKYLPASL